MKIYVLRHGQTNWNVEGRLQGKTDIPLNETGIEQAKEASKQIEDLKIDFAICSPLIRAKQTAGIVIGDRNIPIVYDERIIERAFGEVEGKSYKDFDMSKFYNFYNNEECEKYKVEPIKEVYEKVKSFLEELKEKEQGKDILLITHAATIRVIDAYFKGVPEDGILPFLGYKNCEVREYEL